MKLSDLLFETELEGISDPNEIEITAVCDHTEACLRGCLFIAREGRHFSPLSHLDLLEAKGVAALLVAKGTALPRETGIPTFYAASLSDAEAEAFDRYYGRPAEGMRLFAVTGTNGKTSTALILAHLLHASGIPCGYIGTLGTHLGDEPIQTDTSTMTTPSPSDLYRRLAALKARGASCAVLEVSSHALAEGRVSRFSFDTAIFTNLSEDHLDYHKDMESYFLAKAALFAQAEHAVINRDDAYGERLLSMLSIPKESVGVLADGTDLSVRDLYENGTEETQYLCCAPFGDFPVTYPLFGGFNVYNTLLAIAAALRAGLCPREIREALTTLKKPKGRLEALPLGEAFSVVIDYAHTPDAMEKAIKAVRRATRGRLFVLFGAGGEREREKRPQMGRIACALADGVFITADNARGEEQGKIFADILSGVGNAKGYSVIPDRADAIRAAVLCLKEGDTLLLLGKGHEEYMIEKNETRPFSERAIVAAACKERKKDDHTT